MSTPDVAGVAGDGAGAQVCAVCGAGLEPGAAFCGTCGTRVAAAPGAPGVGVPGVAAPHARPSADRAVGGDDPARVRVDPLPPTRPGGSARKDPLAPGTGPGRGAGAAAPGWSLGADVDDAVAPVWRRLVALLVDQALAVLVGSAGLLAVLPALRSDGSVGALLVPGLLLLLLAAGQWFAEAFGGRTVGGALLGTRTVSARTGRAPGLWAVLVRSVVQALGVLLGGVGVYVVAGSGAWDEGPEQRGWHDKAAGTLVLRARVPRREDDPAPAPAAAAPAPSSAPAGRSSRPTSGPPRPTPTPQSAEVASSADLAPSVEAAPRVAPTSGPPAPVAPTPDAAPVDADVPTRAPHAPADRAAAAPREPAPAPLAAAPQWPVAPTSAPEVRVRPEVAAGTREDLAAPVAPRPVVPAAAPTPVAPAAAPTPVAPAAASDGTEPIQAASAPVLPAPTPAPLDPAPAAPGGVVDTPPAPVADDGARPPRHAAPTPAAPEPAAPDDPPPARTPSPDAAPGVPVVPTPAADTPPDLPDTTIPTADLGDLEHTRVGRWAGSLDAASSTLTLVLDTGVRVAVTGPGLVGRRPVPGAEQWAHLVTIDDPEQSVSSTHLAFWPVDGGLDVVDRGSTNGTVLLDAAGKPWSLPPGQPARVGAGWTLVLGSRRITVSTA